MRVQIADYEIPDHYDLVTLWIYDDRLEKIGRTDYLGIQARVYPKYCALYWDPDYEKGNNERLHLTNIKTPAKYQDEDPSTKADYSTATASVVAQEWLNTVLQLHDVVASKESRESQDYRLDIKEKMNWKAQEIMAKELNIETANRLEENYNTLTIAIEALRFAQEIYNEEEFKVYVSRINEMHENLLNEREYPKVLKEHNEELKAMGVSPIK